MAYSFLRNVSSPNSSMSSARSSIMDLAWSAKFFGLPAKRPSVLAIVCFVPLHSNSNLTTMFLNSCICWHLPPFRCVGLNDLFPGVLNVPWPDSLRLRMIHEVIDQSLLDNVRRDRYLGRWRAIHGLDLDAAILGSAPAFQLGFPEDLIPVRDPGSWVSWEFGELGVIDFPGRIDAMRFGDSPVLIPGILLALKLLAIGAIFSQEGRV